MDKKSKNTLISTVLAIVSVIMIGGSVWIGKVLSPAMAVIFFEFIFNFVVIPFIVKYYYDLYEAKQPSIIQKIIPIHNTTLIMNPSIARLTLFSAVILVLGFALSMNIGILQFLGERWFLIAMDVVPWIVFYTAIIHFLITGIGLAGVSIKVKEFYLSFFRDEDTTSDGILGFFIKLGSISKHLEGVLFILPVIRLIPALAMFERTKELCRFHARFYDYVDPNYEEEYYEEDDYEDEE